MKDIKTDKPFWKKPKTHFILLGILAILAFTRWWCSSDVVQSESAVSPDGQFTAVHILRSGGGATGYVIEEVHVMPPGVNGQGGATRVAELRHAYPVHIRWSGNDTLVVQYAEQFPGTEITFQSSTMPGKTYRQIHVRLEQIPRSR